MTNPWIAGLGAGLSTLGEDLSHAKDLKEQRQFAMDQLTRQAALKNQWKPLNYEMDLGDGKGVGAAEFNEQTGQYRRPVMPEMPTAPATPDIPTHQYGGSQADQALKTLTGNAAPTNAAPVPPVQGPSADAAMQQLTGAPPAPPVTSPAATGVARLAPKQFAPKNPVVRTGTLGDGKSAMMTVGAGGVAAPITTAQGDTLRPAAPTDPLVKRTPQKAMVNGSPAIVMVDGHGTAYDQTGQPVKGKITPYVPPTSSGAGGMGGGFGSGGMPQAGRFIAGVGGLHNADSNMTPYENKVAAHTADFNGLDYYKKLWGQMYDEKGIVDPAIHAIVMANLGSTNPELANYLQSAEMWALEDASISNRPSDFRTKLDGFVSALKPNQNPTGIQQMQHGRVVRLDGYDAVMPAMKAQLGRVAGTPPAPSGPATPPTAAKKTPGQLWDEAVKIHGRATVLKEFGPRPPQ